MFEKFTEHARLAVVHAQEESRLLAHDDIGTGHLLVGLINADGTASQVLQGMGVDVDGARAQVVVLVGTGDSPPTGHIPFTPDAKTMFFDALRHSLRFGHSYLGTGHMLLGMIDSAENMGSRVLVGMETDQNVLRENIESALGRFDIELNVQPSAVRAIRRRPARSWHRWPPWSR